MMPEQIKYGMDRKQRLNSAKNNFFILESPLNFLVIRTVLVMNEKMYSKVRFTSGKTPFTGNVK